MGAGDSATAVAQRAEARAAALRKKAEAAEQRAARFRAGAAGERVLDEAGQGLVDCGWFPLSDRCSPTGGNMDELFVGPAGVVHGTNFVVPPARRAAQVVTVHDVTFLRFPEMCDPATLAYPALIRRAIGQGAYRGKPESEIDSSGYVVATLEAAFWVVARSEDFETAILAAANLGRDADTVAAVTGQLAGALWGYEGIPPQWRTRLFAHDRLVRLGETLFEAGITGWENDAPGRTRTCNQTVMSGPL